jgi:DNA recombination protein RmuC
MELIFLLLGIFLGAAFSYFIVMYKNKLENNVEAENLKMQNLELKVKHQSYQENVDRMMLEMKNQFAYSAGDALSKNNQQFLNLAQQLMDKYIHQAASQFKSTEKEVSQIVAPLHLSLDKNREMMQTFEKNNQSLIENLKSHLESLSVSQRSLEKETYALVSALKNPKIRGKWGEVGLHRIIEFAGLNEYCDFSEQVHSRQDDKTIRPDLIIQLPFERQIIVDSKLPLNAYLLALETNDADEEKKYLKQHAQLVNQHIQLLGSKEYWRNFEQSADFVIMYMEVESAYSAALHTDKELMLRAMGERVILATPSTFISVLQSIAYSWKQYKSSENAKELLNQVHTLHNRLASFLENYQKLGKNIQMLSKTFNQGVGSFESRLMPVIRKIELLSGIQNNDSLELPGKVESDFNDEL